MVCAEGPRKASEHFTVLDQEEFVHPASAFSLDSSRQALSMRYEYIPQLYPCRALWHYSCNYRAKSKQFNQNKFQID